MSALRAVGESEIRCCFSLVRVYIVLDVLRLSRVVASARVLHCGRSITQKDAQLDLRLKQGYDFQNSRRVWVAALVSFREHNVVGLLPD